MASTFSSHQQNAFSGIEPPNRRREIEHCTQVYDVFINHRGPDVKHTLATQLYNSLKAQGISSFLDKEEMELGVSFPSAIKTAITSASVLIAIFSKTYAESPWCLAELVFMLQSKAKIIPLFYQVEPWELRYIENGLYAKAFHEYVEKGRYLDKLEEWREALQQVSGIKGDVLKNSEPSNWKGIVIAVEKEVKRKKLLHVAKYPVGLPKLVKDFERRCLDELVQDIERQCGMKKSATDKAIVVGIYGKGGVGKTTLSKELFNRKISEYTRASFLFDVRQASASGKLPSLQSKLLKDMFCQEHSFSSSEQGTRCLRDRFERNRSFSFLIVLDGIDHEEQLDALLVKDILNKSGNNLVIITTRNKDVLDTAGIGITYPLEGLDRENGRELFCSQAFGQEHPVRGYGDLVRDFVNICGGLPLSLIVLGQHVYGRDQGFWQDELEKVKNTTPGDVKNILKISIDALNDEEKQVFMDIACFSIGKSITMAMAMAIWNGSGFGAHHVLQTLKDKCIIEELDLNLLDRSTLRMHDDLRILGREMADKENHPRRRVWRPQDLEPLESTGFRNILAQTKGRCFHSIVDKSIRSAITYFIGGSTITYLLGVPDTSLLWLQIECPSDQPVDLNPDKNSNIFSGIPLKNLQYLIIRNVCFEELWQSDVQGPLNLIELQITNCKNLKTLPATPELCKLAQLKISGCKKLKELMLAPMICLEIITIEKCSQLKRVSGISKLEKLVELEISGCQKLEFDCLCLTSMKFLERITIDGNVQIKCFQLDRCENLRTVKFDCTSIAQLSIH